MHLKIVIPARAGSKRIPDKNIIKLGSKRLIEYSIETAKKIGSDIDVFINSDDDKIHQLARQHQVTFVERPKNLATDFSTTLDVLKFQLEWFDANDHPCDAIILFQPTNPFRPTSFINECISTFKTCGRKSLATFSALNKKFGTIENEFYSPENYVVGQRMQDLEPRYFENGMLYITTREAILQGRVITDDVYPIITNCIEAHVDIDEPEDLIFAEFLLKNKLV